MKNKAKDKQKKMTLAEFVPWLYETTGAEIINNSGRTDCVVSIDHIESGCFAALYVRTSDQGLAVFELPGCFKNKDDAWLALSDDAETYPPEIFEDWVVHQYLTDKTARVERIEF